MEPLTPTIGFILRIIQVPTAILCILCYKWRFLADYFYYVETAIRLLAMLNLNYSNFYLDLLGLLNRYVLIWLLFTMVTRAELIVTMISLTIQLFVGSHLVWANPITRETALFYVLIILMSFVSTTLANMGLIFISEVFVRLQIAEKGSINLLNGMHEGLLILSHRTSNKPNQFLFCNKSAQRLITMFLGPI